MTADNTSDVASATPRTPSDRDVASGSWKDFVVILSVGFLLASATTSGSEDAESGNVFEQMEHRFLGSQDLTLAYRVALFALKHGNRDEARIWLSRLESESWQMGIDQSQTGDGYHGPEIENLIQSLQSRVSRGANSSVAFSLTDANLIPESIAYDPSSGDAFVGSLYKKKVLRLTIDTGTKKVTEAEFFPGGKNTAGAVYGIKFDSESDQLWVLHNRIVNNEMRGALTVVDQKGRVAKSYSIADSTSRELNDLCLTGDMVYVTDSQNSVILGGLKSGSRLDVVPIGLDLQYPNGIACDDFTDGIFVADASGITRIKIGKQVVANRLQAPKGFSLGGIDGLYVWKGAFVGVQNWLGTPKVLLAKYDDSNTVRSIEFRDAFSPSFRVPTTGFLRQDCFYYIANSSVDLLQSNEQLEPGPEKAMPARILGLNLEEAGAPCVLR